MANQHSSASSEDRLRYLITGAAGQLGYEIVECLGARDVAAFSHGQLDVTDRHAVTEAVLAYQPDVIVNAAAYADVDGAESEPEAAYSVNAWGARNVALAAKQTESYVCYISTDFVFDGTKDYYNEWDHPAPLGVYGASKLAGEQETAAHAPAWSIVRTAWLCGRKGRNFAKTILSLRNSRDTIEVVDDQRGSPSVASDIAAALVEVCARRLEGIFHVTNSGSATWCELAKAIMRAAGDDPERIVPTKTEDLRRPAKRPRSSVLDNACLRAAGLAALRPWQEAFDELVCDLLNDTRGRELK